MTNAEKIRSLSDAELAETYIKVLNLNNPMVNGEVYQSKHTGQIFYTRESAIEDELEWLRKDAPKQTNAEKIRNMDDKELAEFLIELSLHCYDCGQTKLNCHYGSCRHFDEWLKREAKE